MENMKKTPASLESVWESFRESERLRKESAAKFDRELAESRSKFDKQSAEFARQSAENSKYQVDTGHQAGGRYGRH